MGYDLHVTRAEDWKQSAEHPITASEWSDTFGADPNLRPDPEHRPHAVLWMGPEAVRGWFDWYGGAIYTTNPDRPTVAKMLEFAARLNARVQGDQGEFYETPDDWTAG